DHFLIHSELRQELLRHANLLQFLERVLRVAADQHDRSVEERSHQLDAELLLRDHFVDDLFETSVCQKTVNIRQGIRGTDVGRSTSLENICTTTAINCSLPLQCKSEVKDRCKA